MFSLTPELLAIALLLDLLLGDPHRLPHPVAGIGRLISIEERLYRRIGLDGYGGGLLLCLLTVTGTAIAAWLLLHLLQQSAPCFECRNRPDGLDLPGSPLPAP